MRAGWYERAGPAQEVLQIGEMEQPTPAAGEVLVCLFASGLNPSDYKRRANTKSPPEFPRIIPHSDGSGVVAGVGAGVSEFREGDRVWVYNAQWGRPFGTAAEYVALPARLVAPLPENASFVQGACFGIPAMTAYHSIHICGAVAGKTVYVPGATGRVGAYAVQFAKWRGARVIASTSSGEAAREALKALGADVVLDRTSTDVGSAILHETGGRGVDRIVEVDLPGNIGLDERILAERGAIVSFGAASASSVPITQWGRRARNMGLHFIFIYMLDAPTFAATVNGINEMAKTGRLIHRIGGKFALDDLARAHSFAETNSGSGHVVIEIR